MISRQIATLYKVKQTDVAKAGAVMADAFQEDPVWSKVFEGVARNDPRLGAWYEAALRFCLKYGAVYAPSERLEGAAAWLPGDRADMTAWRMLRSGAFWSGMKMGPALGRRAQKMTPVFAPLEADRKAHMQGRAYIYLMMIGVASRFQGQGFGGKLLRALIEESEQAGVPIYLETETEKNVRMYERLGFRVVNQIALPIIGLPMWEMVREPGT